MQFVKVVAINHLSDKTKKTGSIFLLCPESRCFLLVEGKIGKKKKAHLPHHHGTPLGSIEKKRLGRALYSYFFFVTSRFDILASLNHSSWW